MIANVIWLYSFPFAIFQRWFPLLVIFVIVGEAAILTAGRIPWKRSLICSLVGNVASYVAGFLLVGMSRGVFLPDGRETFTLQSHLWLGFAIAYVLSVVVEAPIYRWLIRPQDFRRLLLLAFAANLASYAAIIAVNWDACRNVTQQMGPLPERPAASSDQVGEDSRQ
jgi:hypothetical protein